MANIIKWFFWIFMFGPATVVARVWCADWPNITLEEDRKHFFKYFFR